MEAVRFGAIILERLLVLTLPLSDPFQCLRTELSRVLEVEEISTLAILQLQEPVRRARAVTSRDREFQVFALHGVGSQSDPAIALLLERVGDAGMGNAEMIMIAGEVFGQQLPIRRHHVAVRTGQHFEPADILAAQKALKIPLSVAEIVIKRHRIGIPVTEDQSPDPGDARHLDEAEARRIELVAIGIFQMRDACERTVLIRPSVVGAGEASRGAAVEWTDDIGAVPALVEEEADFTLGIALYD